jgi:hypothetical protein
VPASCARYSSTYELNLRPLADQRLPAAAGFAVYADGLSRRSGQYEISPAIFDEVDDLLVRPRLCGVFDDVAAIVIGPPSQSGTSSARSSSRSAAASSFDLRNVRPVLRYPEDLSTFDHRRHHLTHPTSDPSRLQRRSAGSALLNDGSLRRSMRNRTATRREDRRHRPTHLPGAQPRGKAIGRSRLRSAGCWPGFCHGRRSSRRSHGLPCHAMPGH